MGGCGREDVTTVKGLADWLAKDPSVRDRPHLVFLARVDYFQNPVVWRDKIMSRGFHQDGPAGAAYARVDHHNVDRVLRKVGISLRDQIGTLSDSKRSNLMANVHDLR
jgi:hypothetical protein